MHWIAGMLITYKLCGVATGLKYLHSNDVVHGNLGPVCGGSSVGFTIGLTCVQPNILVDDSGRVRITDFGLATMPRGPNSQRAFVDDQTVPWTAPEILNDRGTYSKEADVFSFAMVMVEVRQMDYRPLSLSSLSFRLDAGSHRCSPVWCQQTQYGGFSYNGRKSSVTADPSDVLRQIVEGNATLLEPGTPPAPEGFRGAERLTWIVA